MTNDQGDLFKEVMKKLEIGENRLVLKKAQEIQGLASLKPTGSISTLNDYSKIVIFLDISCELLNVTFDTDIAVSITKMRKTLYNTNRKTILKLLNLNKDLDVNSVILKMGISNTNVQKTAMKIYEAYKTQAFHTDLDHPQYPVMSVFQACKLEKVKVVKQNFINASNLKPSQWTKLEKSLETLVLSIGKADKENLKSKSTISDVSAAQQDKEPSQKLKRKHEEPEIEDYDVWAKRTIEKALNELKAMGKSYTI